MSEIGLRINSSGDRVRLIGYAKNTYDQMKSITEKHTRTLHTNGPPHLKYQHSVLVEFTRMSLILVCKVIINMWATRFTCYLSVSKYNYIFSDILDETLIV